MRSSIVIFVLLVLVFACSVLIKRMVAKRHPDSCLHQRSAILHQTIKKPDVQIPQCTLYGNYYPQQCNTGDGTCWCVTPQGKPIPGTMVQNTEPSQCQLNWFQLLFQRMQN